MIDFKPVKIEDKAWMDPYFIGEDCRASECNFTSAFLWGNVFNQRVALVGDHLTFKADFPHGCCYRFPWGRGDTKSVIEELMDDARACGNKFTFTGVNTRNVQRLEALFPGLFEIKPHRPSFDYIYTMDKLADLAGKKLHSKRNHINKFIAENPGWSFELINPGNLDECYAMNKKWQKLNSIENSRGLQYEDEALDEAFKYFDQLRLDGGLLRSGGRVIAYTMGEPLNSDTYVVHFEKAYYDVSGAYAMINREFARFVRETYPVLEYINREDDMGEEGLRKAKLSYYPDIMFEKYTAVLKD